MNLFRYNLNNNENLIFLSFSIIIAISIVLFFNLSTNRKLGFDSILLIFIYSILIYLILTILINYNYNKLYKTENFNNNEYYSGEDNLDDKGENILNVSGEELEENRLTEEMDMKNN